MPGGVGGTGTDAQRGVVSCRPPRRGQPLPPALRKRPAHSPWPLLAAGHTLEAQARSMLRKVHTMRSKEAAPPSGRSRPAPRQMVRPPPQLRPAL